MSEQTGYKLDLLKVYVKDISFESPMAPGIFNNQSATPGVDVQLNVRHQAVDEGVYECVLIVSVNGKLDDKHAFLAEVHQAGVYRISGIEQDADLTAMLEITCPNMLFPFAREAVNDLVGRGGFPQLLLSPINFERLYKHKQQNKTGNGQGDDKAGEAEA